MLYVSSYLSWTTCVFWYALYFYPFFQPYYKHMFVFVHFSSFFHVSGFISGDLLYLLRAMGTIGVVSLIEALTDQVDNLVLPLVFYTMTF